MDIFSDILSNLKLEGTLYFRTSFTSPWSIRVPPYRSVSRFHFAHRGRCLIRINPDEEAVKLEQGDLILITHGAPHTIFCQPQTEHSCVELETVIEESKYDGNGTLVYGTFSTQHETQLICGHFSFDTDAKHSIIDTLPPYIHIKNYGADLGTWMESTLKIIGLEAGKNDLGSNYIALKLSEIIYSQAIRSYLNSDEAKSGVLAGFTDLNLRKAIESFHNSPDYAWTIAELSKTAGLSLSSFSKRFKSKLSMTPHHYMTQWRLQLARRYLKETNEPIIRVAEMVGYQSVPAFSRVFKKEFGVAPVKYRHK